MSDALFDLEELNREQAVRDEYAKSPALTPFSRSSISYYLATALGTRSGIRAQRRIIFGTPTITTRNSPKGNR